MKKIYMIFSVFALCASCLVSIPSLIYAQGKLNGVISSPIHGTQVPYTRILNPPSVDSRTISGQWLDYWNVEDSISIGYGLTPSRFYDALFPDSDVTICSDPQTCVSPQVHLIGTVLDPSSTDLQTYYGYHWSKANPYWVDSLKIFFSYIRNSDPSIVDTLVVYLINDSADAYVNDTTNHTIDTFEVDLPVYGYYGGDFYDNYGDSSVTFALLRYDTNSTNIPMPTTVTPGDMQTFKIPLTADYVALPGTSIYSLSFGTNHYSVPAGRLVAAAFGFIPGYDYSPFDQITDAANAFFFYSDELNDGLKPDYAPYTPGDYNVSEVVDNGTRYGTDVLGFKTFFRPTYSYVGYQLQEHLVSYYVTGTYDVGINESSSSEGTKLYQNQPNPANHTTLINYETSTAGAVTMEIRDLTGRVVMEFNQGTQSAGKHVVDVDLTGISKGMYLYTLKTEKESISRRMVVSE